jgi:hypothetical protein
MNEIQTTAPIPIEQIKEYFKDKTTVFKIDYAQSKLQGKILLVYLSNLDIPCDIILSDAVTQEQKFELLESYFSGNSIANIPYLNAASSQIVLEATGIDTTDFGGLLTKSECVEFIQSRLELVSQWAYFLDSTMVYLIKMFTDLDEQLNVKENFPNIDDPNFVGLNVINLLNIAGFLEIYFSSDRPLNLLYLTQQFEAHMFKGKSLFDYYNKDTNIFVPLLHQTIKNVIPLNPEEVFGVE